ncbi:MAG: GIY-YIG nuclease family protein [Candidatus Omnitrophica bacterium]|nr:GIY-YIG nuclease family protein [Candidatus Omnitrophota bacterium]MBU1906459.1 GIY-YIG nuclease family protein [Candidatus Omnitrophota bacterium]
MLWCVYIIQCKDSKLYTGITSNLKRRIREHNSGSGCRFTRRRVPVTLLHDEKFTTRSEALKREARIKTFNRQGKLELITNEKA